MGEQIVPEEVFETSSCRAVSVSNDEEVPRESSSLFVRISYTSASTILLS